MIYMIAVASRRCRSTPTTSPVTEEYDKDWGQRDAPSTEKNTKTSREILRARDRSNMFKLFFILGSGAFFFKSMTNSLDSA